MLILTRYPRQSIIVGKDVIVTVLEIRRSGIRLGITAPPGTIVDREEVRQRKHRTSTQDEDTHP